MRLRSPTWARNGGCVSAPRLGRGTEAVSLFPGVSHPDILRCIVVRVDLVAALLALKMFAVAVVVVNEPTIRSGTALGRMVRLNLFDGDATLRSFVLDMLEQPTKRPDMMPLRLWQPLSNIGQILEYDYITIVFDGFHGDLIGDRVNVLFPPCFFTLGETKQSVVGSLRAALLHLTTAFLKLTTPVIVVVTLQERAG